MANPLCLLRMNVTANSVVYLCVCTYFVMCVSVCTQESNQLAGVYDVMSCFEGRGLGARVAEGK